MFVAEFVTKIVLPGQISTIISTTQSNKVYHHAHCTTVFCVQYKKEYYRVHLFDLSIITEHYNELYGF